MNLEIAEYPVKQIRLSHRFKYENQAIDVDESEIVALVLEDARIEDVSLAVEDGYTSGKGLGLGLPGAKRLVNVFEIQSETGKGTTVTIIQWKNGRTT